MQPKSLEKLCLFWAEVLQDITESVSYVGCQPQTVDL